MQSIPETTVDIKEKVCRDVDVVYEWTALQQSVLQEEERMKLLDIIISKYIVLRGNSFASSYMEMYKQKTKKTIQKSKALRKKV